LIPSAYTDYPTKIKFHSIDLQWDKSSKILTRSTYTILDLFKDVGGFGSFLLTTLSIVVPFFGNVKILGMIASSGYVRSRNASIEKQNTLDRMQITGWGQT
jgi:hypothetical protein